MNQSNADRSSVLQRSHSARQPHLEEGQQIHESHRERNNGVPPFSHHCGIKPHTRFPMLYMHNH